MDMKTLIGLNIKQFDPIEVTLIYPNTEIAPDTIGRGPTGRHEERSIGYFFCIASEPNNYVGSGMIREDLHFIIREIAPSKAEELMNIEKPILIYLSEISRPVGTSELYEWNHQLGDELSYRLSAIGSLRKL